MEKANDELKTNINSLYPTCKVNYCKHFQNILITLIFSLVFVIECTRSDLLLELSLHSLSHILISHFHIHAQSILAH